MGTQNGIIGNVLHIAFCGLSSECPPMALRKDFVRKQRLRLLFKRAAFPRISSAGASCIGCTPLPEASGRGLGVGLKNLSCPPNALGRGWGWGRQYVPNGSAFCTRNCPINHRTVFRACCQSICLSEHVLPSSHALRLALAGAPRRNDFRVGGNHRANNQQDASPPNEIHQWVDVNAKSRAVAIPAD